MKNRWIVLVLMIPLYLNPEGTEAEFITRLSGRETAHFSDLVTSFCYLYGLDVTSDAGQNLRTLKSRISYLPKNINPVRPCTIGDFSLFAMQYLKLRSGIFYLALKSGRYASRELMMRRIIPANTSEYERLSGIELMRYIQKVVEYETSEFR